MPSRQPPTTPHAKVQCGVDISGFRVFAVMGTCPGLFFATVFFSLDQQQLAEGRVISGQDGEGWLSR